MSPQNKQAQKRYQQLFVDIQTVLFEDWDPIGINDIAPGDEYDNYISRVANALSRQAGVEAIDALLKTIEREAMGIYSNAGKRHSAALKLKKLGDQYFK